MSEIPGAVIRDWRECRLWKILEGRTEHSAETVRAALIRFMPDIQGVLDSGDTSPTDFTLHDSQHGFRVASRMVTLIAPEVLTALSSYELGLLIFSAYLHDIGMTPVKSRIRDHAVHLRGAPGLTATDAAAFDQWLDAHGERYGRPSPGGSGQLASDGVAELLLAHYCRSRHVEWTDDWIRAEMLPFGQPFYQDWLLDLQALCKSHHQGFESLVQPRFDPRQVDSQGAVVHLRFLASMLRVADVLENDPERTPDIVFRHRHISPGSVIFWYKDRGITIGISSNQVTVQGRLPNAKLHKAVLDLCDSIEAELELVHALNDARPFSQFTGQGTRKLGHAWHLAPRLWRDVLAQEGTYEFIEGSFRPDTAKVLKLLSGKELYRNELDAIRELLQNAFDAVRQRIAYERLGRPNPSDPSWEAKIGELLLVELVLEIEDSRLWLRCTDMGVGMTKTIIRDQVLVSGTSRGRDVADLERRARAAGFEVGRTGQFGIGFLSYFMIGDMVRIRTKRTQLAPDDEGHGWKFETEGISSFGELRKEKSVQQGTEVWIRLKKPAKEIEQVLIDLKEFVQETVINAPCPIRIRLANASEPALELRRGWCATETDLTTAFIENSFMEQTPPDHDLLPRSLLNRKHTEKGKIANLKGRIASELIWKTTEGALANGLGSYRIHIPWSHDSGVSAIFPIPKSGLREADGLQPNIPIRSAWKGMEVRMGKDFAHHPPWQTQGFLLEVNWSDHRAGLLSANRESLDPSDEARAAIDLVRKQARAILQAAAQNQQSKHLGSANWRWDCVTGPTKAPTHWLVAVSAEQASENKALWRELRFPLLPLDSEYAPYAPLKIAGWGKTRRVPIEVEGKAVEAVLPVSLARSFDLSGIDQTGTLLWPGFDLGPDVLVALTEHGKVSAVVPIWTELPSRSAGRHPELWRAKFPPEWRDIAAIECLGAPVWNQDHVIAKDISDESITWLFENRPSRRRFWDPRPILSTLLESPAKARCWWMTTLPQESELLEGYLERYPDDFLKLWKVAFGSLQQVRLLIYDNDEPVGLRVEPTGPILNHVQLDEIRGWLKVPIPSFGGVKR